MIETEIWRQTPENTHTHFDQFIEKEDKKRQKINNKSDCISMPSSSSGNSIKKIYRWRDKSIH